MQEYRFAKGWRIFSDISLVIFALLFGGMAATIFLPGYFDNLDFYAKIGFFILATVVFCLSILGIYDMRKHVFITKKNGNITWRNSIFTRKLLKSDIKGYRKTENYIFIIPKYHTHKRIKVSTYIENLDKFISWLDSHFVDLNYEEYQIEKELILTNKVYGNDLRTRKLKIKKAGYFIHFLSAISVIVFFIGYGLPSYFYFESVVISFFIIPACILTMLYFKGLTNIEGKESSYTPTMALPLVIGSLSASLAGLGYEILDYRMVYLTAIPIGILLIYIVLKLAVTKPEEEPESKFPIIFFSILFTLYAASGIIFLNCEFDSSPAEIFHSTILEKKNDDGQFHLKITPWDQATENYNLKLYKDKYHELPKGDKVIILQKRGLFGIPWFEPKFE